MTSRLITLDQLSREEGVSLPNAKRMINEIEDEFGRDSKSRSCPVRQWGSLSQSYKIDPTKFRAWRKKRDEARQAAREEPTDEADARIKLAKAELLEDQLAEKRGELIPYALVRQEFEDVFAYLSNRLQALPDHLQLKFDLSGELTEAVHKEVTEWQAETARLLKTETVLSDG